MKPLPCLSTRLNFLSFAVLAFAVVLATGCKQKAAPVPSDQEIASSIQSKLGGEPALSGQGIQVAVNNGVATLKGTVSSDAARVLAGNEAGTIGGVKTVVNNLTVEQAQAQPPAAVNPAPAPAQAKPAARRESDRDRERERRRMERDRDRADNAQAPYQPVEAPSQSAPVPVAQTPAAPPPPPAPIVRDVTLAAGTVVPVRITETLDTKTAQPNDAFHGALAGDLMSNGVVVLPRGAAVTGRIVDAREAAHFKGASLLSLELTEVAHRGREISLVTDTYSQQGAGRGKNTATKTGAGAAFGAIVGALAGGGKGAAIGGLAGAGAGAGINAATRGEQVVIPTETVLNFKLQNPVTVRVTLGPDGLPMNAPNADPALQHR